MSKITAKESQESSEVTSMAFKDTELTLALPGHTEFSSGKSSASKAQVVGWPPVRVSRKKSLERCKYVKVAVDGAPYLRKVNLDTCNDYQELVEALEERFSCFQIRRDNQEDEMLVDLVNGVKYVPTYEDKDGDWMLVGDVPWKMFVELCSRIRVMRSSDQALDSVPMTPSKSGITS